MSFATDLMGDPQEMENLKETFDKTRLYEGSINASPAFSVTLPEPVFTSKDGAEAVLEAVLCSLVFNTLRESRHPTMLLCAHSKLFFCECRSLV